jgi:outer membrane murein-binding lipoprotein Lpp
MAMDNALLILEKLDDLGGKVDRIDTKVDQLESKMGLIDSKVDQLESKVGLIDSKVDQLESKVGLIESKVEHMDAKIDDLGTSVKHLTVRVGVVESNIAEVKEITMALRHSQEIFSAKLDAHSLILGRYGSSIEILNSRQLKMEVDIDLLKKKL